MTQLHHCTHPFLTFLQLPLVSVTRLHYSLLVQQSPNICKLDSGSSCLCVSFGKHCSQSAASSGSATAACTVSALTFSDRNEVDELWWIHKATHEQTGANLKYIRVVALFLVLPSTMISHQVLHLGWSSMCFTALVTLIDGQMRRRVLCFFLLPGCSSAWQTYQLQARSGRRQDSC